MNGFMTGLLGKILYHISYFKQLSAVIKMYNYKIKTSFVSLEMPKARAYKINVT